MNINLDSAKDTLCKNILIYGYCKYENKGCVFSHSTKPGNGVPVKGGPAQQQNQQSQSQSPSQPQSQPSSSTSWFKTSLIPQLDNLILFLLVTMIFDKSNEVRAAIPAPCIAVKTLTSCTK
jgi:hypothetical protein